MPSQNGRILCDPREIIDTNFLTRSICLFTNRAQLSKKHHHA
ncbi:MAG: hypothetical protein RLZZ245_153 [Verrucomicrobiota bacterium]